MLTWGGTRAERLWSRYWAGKDATGGEHTAILIERSQFIAFSYEICAGQREALLGGLIKTCRAHGANEFRGPPAANPE